jgi:hypothetical protein
MTRIQFEITWEDAQAITNQITKKEACKLLASIESGLRSWFNANKADALSYSLDYTNQNTKGLHTK